MANEETIKQELEIRFSFLADKIRVARERRIFTGCVDQEHFIDVFGYIVQDQKFEILCTITGLDEGENLEVVYHLSRQDGTVLNLRTCAPKANPVIKTVSKFFPAAELYERELVDLLGMKIDGLAEGPRYPLPADWPPNMYPLRKDWTPDMLTTINISPDICEEESDNG